MGYEREPERLQLRFPALDNEGVCDVVLDEQPSQIVVRVVLCYREDGFDALRADMAPRAPGHEAGLLHRSRRVDRRR